MKITAVALIFALLVLALSGAKVSGETSALPVELQEIWVRSPEDNVSYIDSVPLVFTISLLPYSGPYSSYSGPYSPFGEVELWHNGYSYSLDGNANVSIAGNTSLTGLANGTHSIRVYESLDYFSSYFMAGIGPQPYGTAYSNMAVFSFSNTIPTISNLSVENKTYDTKRLALNFSVSEPIASAWYSLDGQSNVTILGNMTLGDLTEGSHSIVIYANDTVGNTGASQMVYFEVELAIFPTELFAVTATSVVVFSICALAYFKKRKQSQENSLVVGSK